MSPLEENVSNRGKGRVPKGRGPRHTFCPPTYPKLEPPLDVTVCFLSLSSEILI